MAKRKTLFKLMLGLVCSAVIVWLGVGCGEEIDVDYKCGTDSLRVANQTREVGMKYRKLFLRQPNSPRAREGFLRDEKTGERTETWGIVITVDGGKVDQALLSTEDRIPDEIEGVPVQIISWQVAEKAYVPQGAFSFEGDPHFYRAIETISKNIDLFDHYPFSNGARPYGIGNSNGMSGIEFFVSEMVDPFTVAPEERIPACLEDIPVRILEGDPTRKSQ